MYEKCGIGEEVVLEVVKGDKQRMAVWKRHDLEQVIGRI